ncbi:hypothetical protein D6T17_08770 [Salmonella enterica subsp. enterica serovar Oranienburg]|nr:hypothetical protein [Salmonella enterica subsp. enterica serovar Oranienburg]EBY8944467.1 hypothetical protein [Salmonella enterica subsp. enterica serovar Oranienburg]
MCFTSKNCYKTGNFSCVLKQKDPDFLKRFSAIWFFLITQIGAFFLIVAESFQFSGRGDTCSSYRFRTFIRASRPEIKKRPFGKSPPR